MALLRVPQSPSLRLGLSFYAATHGRWPAELLPAWRAGGWNSALKPYSRLTKTRRVPQARFGSLRLGVACSVWDPAAPASVTPSLSSRPEQPNFFFPSHFP